MVTIPPIKMVIWGWFIIVLPTLIIFDMISVWFHINWFVGIIHFVGFMISLTKGTFWIIWLIRIIFSDSWTISNFVGFILLIHEVMKKNMAPVVEGEFPVEQLRATNRCDRRLGSSKPENRSRGPSTSRFIVNECSKVCKTDPWDPWIRSGSNLKTILSINPLDFLLAPRQAATMGDSRMVAWHDFAPLLSGRPGAFPRRCRKWSCWSGTRGLAVCHVAGRCKGLELIFACARSMQEYHRGHFGWQEVYSILVTLRTL